MAGVWETFCILFTSNADEVEDAANDAEKASGDLEKKLKATDETAKQAGESFGALAKRAVGVLAPIIGISALVGGALAFAQGAEAAGNLADKVGVAVDSLQAWQGAATRSGADAGALAADMGTLTKTLFDMKRGGGGDAGWAIRRLGISIRDETGRIKGADRMLLDLSGRFEGLSRQQAVRLGERLGLSEDTVTLLMKGRKGIEGLVSRQKELGVTTARDVEVSRKFNGALGDMGQAFGSVTNTIFAAALPAVTEIVDTLTDFALTIKEHEPLVMGFFIGLGAILGVLAIKMGIAFSPVILITGLILLLAAAFAILYDDVMNFLDGNDSVIGEMSKKWPWIGQLVHFVADALKALWSVAKAVFGLLVDGLKDPKKAWDDFKKKIDEILNWFAAKYPALGEVLKAVFDGATKLFEGWVTNLKAIFGALFDFLKALFSGDLGAILETGKALFDAWKTGVTDLVQGAADAILSIFSALWGLVEKTFPDFGTWARAQADTITGFLGRAIEWVKNKLQDFLDVLPDAVKSRLGLPLQRGTENASPTTTDPLMVQASAGGLSPPRPPNLPLERASPPVSSASPDVLANLRSGQKATPPPNPPLALAQAPALNFPPEVLASLPPDVLANLRSGQKATPPPNPPLALAQSPAFSLPPEVLANLLLAQKAMASTRVPLAAGSPQALAGAKTDITKTTSVTIGEVTVHTQATDAQGVASGFGQAAIQAIIDNSDDGRLS